MTSPIMFPRAIPNYSPMCGSAQTAHGQKLDKHDSNPEKIMKIAKKLIAIIYACLAASLMLMSQASYAVDAGHAQFVNGSVRISSADGQKSILKKGGVVREGDTLTTASAASAQIKMLDGGLIAVRSDTKLKFDTFKFNGTQDGSERSFFSLFTGGFRAVTGLIGKLHKSSFRITTAAATIGIRGTDHETFVVTAGSPMAAVAPIGTYNKVNWGETTMTTAKGTISVLPNQMGYVSAADQMPELKPLNTRLFTATSGPLTKANGSKEEDKELRKTAAADNTEKRTAVEAAASAGKKDGEDVLKTGGKNVPSNRSTGIASVPVVLPGVNIDHVTALNWGRWNDSIKVTNRVTGEITTYSSEGNMARAAGPAGMTRDAGPTGTDAASLPVSDINTYSNAKGTGTASTNNLNNVGANLGGPASINSYSNTEGTGTASTNNLNTVGANLGGPASQSLINDSKTFMSINNSNEIAHRNSGRGITP